MPESAFLEVATTQSITASEIGGIFAVQDNGDDLDVVGLWFEASSISGGGHDLSKEMVALAISKHVKDVSRPTLLNGIWHTHPFGRTQWPDYSAQDEATILGWIDSGRKIYSLLFGGNLLKGKARVDWQEGNIHYVEWLEAVWILSEYYERYKTVKELERAYTPLRPSGSHLPTRKTTLYYGNRGRAHWLDGWSSLDPDGDEYPDDWWSQENYTSRWNLARQISDAYGVNIQEGYEELYSWTPDGFEDFFGFPAPDDLRLRLSRNVQPTRLLLPGGSDWEDEDDGADGEFDLDEWFGHQGNS